MHRQAATFHTLNLSIYSNDRVGEHLVTNENLRAGCNPATPTWNLGHIKLMTSCVTVLLNDSLKLCSTLPFSSGRRHRLACRGKDLQSSSLLHTSALAPRSAECIPITGTHMLPAVTDIMQTREYAGFDDRVLASHDRAYILDISPAMTETLAEMQACTDGSSIVAAFRPCHLHSILHFFRTCFAWPAWPRHVL